MKRDVLKKMQHWKNDPERKPLILKGARQVGKTWLMKEFGTNFYESYVYLNFYEDPALHSIFQTNKNPARIIDLLSLIAQQKIYPEKTLIIFDEVQECPEALNSLKYFKEDGTVNFKQFLDDTKEVRVYYDPLALDLNGNKRIDTLTLEEGVFFDHDGDNVAFKSSWVNKEDGILARDINANGRIDNGSELFGNFTAINNEDNKVLAKDGFTALKALDSNNDGIIDSKDSNFDELLVWRDLSSNNIFNDKHI